ncbi:hypothetical protein NKH77_13340 [Streptomyces sp. M19]
MSEMNAEGRSKVDRTPEWNALAKHREELADTHLRELFADDPGRAERYTLRVGDLHLDYSKHLITDTTLRLLRELAEATGWRGCGTPCSAATGSTPPRTAPCSMSRCAPRSAVIAVDGEDVVPEVHAVLTKMATFTDRIRSGDWTGHTGRPIKNIVNIGIGGSDLGPAMAYEALRAFTART